jgi:hypothetical protein
MAAPPPRRAAAAVVATPVAAAAGAAAAVHASRSVKTAATRSIIPRAAVPMRSIRRWRAARTTTARVTRSAASTSMNRARPRVTAAETQATRHSMPAVRTEPAERGADSRAVEPPPSGFISQRDVARVACACGNALEGTIETISKRWWAVRSPRQRVGDDDSRAWRLLHPQSPSSRRTRAARARRAPTLVASPHCVVV